MKANGYIFYPNPDYDYEADPTYNVFKGEVFGPYIDAVTFTGEIIYMVGECVELREVDNGLAHIYNRGKDIYAAITIEQFIRDFGILHSL